MKRSCKHTDITDWRTVYPWVMDCIGRHYKRYDFRAMLCGIGGMSPEAYRKAVMDQDKGAFGAAGRRIAEDACRRIRERDLRLRPVTYKIRIDGSSGKVRRIGCESAEQQILDYIAVYSCNEIWARRLVPQQASSLPGRGQCYGVKILQHWMEEDERAERYAAKNGRNYILKCAYSVKLDVKDCYGSGDKDIFLRLFRRDCGNDDILWLWDALLQTHQVDGYQGLMIGALISQFAMQYLISFAYRQVMSQHYSAHGRQYRRVQHCLIYMDDILLLGSNARELERAAKTLASYMRREIGLTIKPGWAVMSTDVRPVDMMGYVIRRGGKVTIRSRVFIRLRRQALRYLRTRRMTYEQALRICSYKGYALSRRGLNLRSMRIYHKYRLSALFRRAARIVSAQTRRLQHEQCCLLQRAAGGDQVYAAAGR